jgi:hypothetical protein
MAGGSCHCKEEDKDHSAFCVSNVAMSAPLTLVVFQANNPQGRSLAAAAKVMARDTGFEVRICSDGAQEDLIRACLSDDYVLFDASVEKGHNYAIAVELFKSLPYALVVSRTYLPINFTGTISGGAPEYPASFTNDQILSWLGHQLRCARENPPRQKPESVSLSAVLSTYEDVPDLPSSDVFISYRGQLIAVEEFAKRVEGDSFDDSGCKNVKIFQPAPRTFHQTAMTAFDRWAVLAVISDSIIGSEEVWVYESKGEYDYLKSWWTIGELVVCAYRNRPLKIYDIETEKLKAPQAKHLISLSESQKDRLSMLFTNSHPRMMAPESVERIQKSWLLRRLPYYRDVVFSKLFTELYLMQCNRCIDWQALLDPAVFLDVAGMSRGLIPGFYGVETERMSESYISCPNCGARYRIQPKSAYFLWVPTRPFGHLGSVKERPMFELVMEE